MSLRLALIASVALLTACSTAGPEISPVNVTDGIVRMPQPTPTDGQLQLALASGTYRCDLGQRVDVHRDAGNEHAIRIGWTGRHYRLERNASHSGLPRFEDPGSGLVWIDLPWKSVLLDGRRNKPLASDCILS